MVAKEYGRFKPDTEERDRWERIATTRDQEKWPRGVAKDVATRRSEGEKAHEETPATLGECEASAIAGAGLEPATPAL
jgi:hypothetical protein